MLTDSQLLNRYKEEKALIIGDVNERTGLEPFPTFKEWKLDYMKEYAGTHDMDNPMKMEDAVAALEAELDEADDDLLPEEDLAALAADTPETPEEEDSMTEEVTTPAAEAAEAKPASKPKATKKKVAAKKKPATKKAPAKKPAAKKAPAKKAAAKKSKAAEAQKVFDRLYPKVLEGKKARKDIIDALVDKVGLTANGAATYYQKMKKAYSA
jgi:outer membrane biosynthesis protein TonB